MNNKIDNVDEKDDLQKSIEYLNIISKKRKHDKKIKREKKRRKTMKKYSRWATIWYFKKWKQTYIFSI